MAVHSNSWAQAEGREDSSTGVRPSKSTSIFGHWAKPNKARSRPVILPVVCAIALITAIAAGTSILLFEFRDRALANSERELRNTALILSEQVDRAFQTVDLVQQSLIEQMQSRGIISNGDFERQMSGHDVHLMLKDKISGLPYVENVSLFNSKGDVINFTHFWPGSALNVADRDHFKALKFDAQLTSVVSAPVLNRTTGTWTIYLARKITGPNGEFLGAVIGGLQLQYFERFFGTISLGADSAISLFRRDGILLARHPQRDPPGSSYAKGRLFKNLLSHTTQGTIRLTSIVDGKERLIAASGLAHYPVVVAVATTVAAALAGWEQLAKLLIGAGIFAVLVIAVFAFLTARQVLKRQRQSEHTLSEQKLRLDVALNNMRQGLLLFDSEGRLILHNQRFLQLYHLPPEAVKSGCTLSDLLRLRKAAGTFRGDPDHYVAKLVDEAGAFKGDPDRQIAKIFDEGKAETKEIELPDGRIMSITNQSMRGGWVSTHEDITERRRAEQERDRNREFLDLIIDNVPAPIFVKEASDRRYVLVNEAGEKFWGTSRTEMIGKTSYEVFAKKEADLITARDEQLLQSGQPSFDERQIFTPRNGLRSIMSKRLAVRDGDGRPRYLLGVIEDITERKQAESRIAHMAHHDALTDLPNRVLFRERLEQELLRIQRGGQMAVLYLDLDQFKTVNDTLGHPIGDQLLKAVAARLLSCVRDADVVARLGGDEFAIIQTDTTGPIDVINLVARIHQAIRKPCEADGHQLVADTSIGIAMAPNDGTDPDQLLKNADLAMYGAKADGRGTYRFFEPAMDASSKARSALEFELREALMCGGFELYYQPVANLRDDNIASCEALIRWQHPKRGMISPAEFVSIAEETGLITILGEWVLRTACAEAATWPDDIKVAVNVSPVQFKNGNLVQTVINALGASRLPAHRLELEITEAVLIHDDAAALAVLHQLRGLGVRISMDDFGTGYSSLSYLQRFPFDKIKIDRSFIKDITEVNGTLPIVQAVVSIAKSRNITTTAEGVETEQQLELLRTLGCTQMQGYLFSRPIPATEVMQLLLQRRGRAVAVA
jgi:diguanylate cyclase (GGDEF)-like protein/PAS domain S-box-containing protein